MTPAHSCNFFVRSSGCASSFYPPSQATAPSFSAPLFGVRRPSVRTRPLQRSRCRDLPRRLPQPLPPSPTRSSRLNPLASSQPAFSESHHLTQLFQAKPADLPPPSLPHRHPPCPSSAPPPLHRPRLAPSVPRRPVPSPPSRPTTSFTSPTLQNAQLHHLRYGRRPFTSDAIHDQQSAQLLPPDPGSHRPSPLANVQMGDRTSASFFSPSGLRLSN